MFDKRTVSKQVARLLVMLNVSSYVSNQLAERVPETKKAHANEVAGFVAGSVTVTKLGPTIDVMVDDFWNRREAKKNASKP